MGNHANKFTKFDTLFRSFWDSTEFETRWVGAESSDNQAIEISLATVKRLETYVVEMRRQEGGRVMVKWFEALLRGSQHQMELAVNIMLQEKPGKLQLPNRLRVLKALKSQKSPTCDEHGQMGFF